MIVTVTLNPALDLFYEVEGLDGEDIIRARRAVWRAGGKGLNVARTLATLGEDCTAGLLLGGATGTDLQDLASGEGLSTVVAWSSAPTRINTVVARPGGRSIKVNAPGGPCTPAEAHALFDLAFDRLAPDWVLFCGSLPEGIGPEVLAEGIVLARRCGARVGVDTSGDALLAALGAGPDLVKVNAEEARAVAGEGCMEALALRLADAAGCEACVTGGVYGAALVSAGRVVELEPSIRYPGRIVGAGDAFFAGLIMPGTPYKRLITGTRCAGRWAARQSWIG